MPLQGQELGKLRWRCIRRGLLELDIKLGKFLDEQYSGLTEAQATAFGELAMMEDPELWEMIAGRKNSDNPAHQEILALLSKG